MARRRIRTTDDVLDVLDRLFASDASGASQRWDGFYADRGRAVPFLVAKPDENLVAACDSGLLVPGRALDLGLLDRVLAPGGYFGVPFLLTALFRRPF